MSCWIGGLGLVSTAFQAAQVLEPSLALLSEKRIVQLLLLNDGCLFALGTFLWLSLFQAVTWPRLAMIVLLAIGSALEVVHHDASFMSAMKLEPEPVLPLAIFLGALAAVVAGTIWNDRFVALIGPRGTAIARILGLMTYPLYLLHNVCGAVLMRAVADSGGNPGQALLIPVCTMTGLTLFVTCVAEPSLRERMARVLPMRVRPAQAES